MKDDIDLKLEALLRAPERAPDEAFAVGMERTILVEARLLAARRVAWTRFGVEMLAAACAIVAFLLLARLTPADSEGLVPLFSPAMVGLLILALWLLVSVRPSGKGLSGL